MVDIFQRKVLFVLKVTVQLVIEDVSSCGTKKDVSVRTGIETIVFAYVLSYQPSQGSQRCLCLLRI